MNEFYYIDEQGNQKGPVDLQEIFTMNLPHSTLVRKEGTSDWSYLWSVFTDESDNDSIQEADDLDSSSLKRKRWLLIHLIMLFIFYLPCVLLFQYLTMKYASDGNLEYEQIRGVRSFCLNLVTFAQRHWPLITIGIAAYYALAEYFAWGNDEYDKLKISAHISIATLILGILMIFFPQVTVGIIMGIIVLIGFLCWANQNNE